MVTFASKWLLAFRIFVFTIPIVAAADPTDICVFPSALNFGPTLSSLNFQVWRCSTGMALNYTVTDDQVWLNITPTNGSSAGEHDTITAMANRTGLPEGIYSAQISVTPAGASPLSIPVAMTVSAVPQTNLTPIARWDVVPRQRIEQGQTLKVGVVAFSKYGIQKIRFTLNGGTPLDVTAMTYNDQSDVWEYWFPISSASFTTAGPISVAATAYGNDGGTRTLPTLTLIVNPQSVPDLLPRPQAWVAATGGSDTTGTVNDSTKPFATIGKAMDKIRSWMSANGYGSKADGGIVRLRPGEHMLQNAGLWVGVTTYQEWVTITSDPASGGNRNNTKINQATPDGQFLSSEWLKIEDLTLQAPANNRPFFETGSSDNKAIWLNDCTLIGSDRYDTNPHPVGQNYRLKYFTNSTLTNLRFAQAEGYSAQLARNLTISHIGEDAFADSPVIINVNLSDQDPGPPGGHQWHADAWQSPGITTSAPPPENYIVYNYRGTDLHYQAIFGRVKALSSNNAFVNVFMEMRDPVRDYGSGNEGVGSWLGGTYDHLLLWNSTFIGTNWGHDFWWANESYTGTPQFRMTNASFRGNVFTRWLTTEGLSWTQGTSVEFIDNHYITTSGPLVFTPGQDISILAPGLETNTTNPDFGHPLATSPLLNRIAAPMVPADLDGNPRGIGDGLADIGAFERQSPGGSSSSLSSSSSSSVTSSSSSPGGVCDTSNSTWQNRGFISQQGTFTVEFDAIPNSSFMDGVTAISSNAGTSYEDFGILIRFNSSGTIDARNGTSYAPSGISYTAGTPFHFRLVVNIPSHTYSAYVVAPGMVEQTIGVNFAFRSEQGAVTNLDNLGFIAASGSHQVCGFVLTGSGGSTSSSSSSSSISSSSQSSTSSSTNSSSSSQNSSSSSSSASCVTSVNSWQNMTLSQQQGLVEVNFNATPHSANMDGVMALSDGSGDAYSDFAVLVRFNSDGKIDARDGGRYKAVSSLSYLPGVTYSFRLLIDTTTHTYSAFVTPVGAAPQRIARHYRFRNEQSSTSSLNNFGLFAASGIHTVCGLTVTNLGSGAVAGMSAPDGDHVEIGGRGDQFYEPLQPAACAGANAFLGQVNIASVINLQASPLNVIVEYRDQAGNIRGTVRHVINPHLKFDFIINDLGLTPDTYGTVCVTTDAESVGAWAGEVVRYKANTRPGGTGHDFALLEPFSNSRGGDYSTPLNTYHIGADPRATVANWISISDSVLGDGLGLRGVLNYYNQAGALIQIDEVDIADGGRWDYDAHSVIGGAENRDAVGMARFIPDPLEDGDDASIPEYGIASIRYIYDCLGSACTDFLTAFSLPHRPSVSAVTVGDISTVDSVISVIEINNTGIETAQADISAYDGAGMTTGRISTFIPALSTRHLIANRVGDTGFVAHNSVGTARAEVTTGKASTLSMFYKLNNQGRLEYAFAAPFVGPHGPRQVLEFNSFIGHSNVAELINGSDVPRTAQMTVLNFDNSLLLSREIAIAPNGTERFTLSVPEDAYGTIIVDGEGIVARSYIAALDHYVMPFTGR